MTSQPSARGRGICVLCVSQKSQPAFYRWSGLGAYETRIQWVVAERPSRWAEVNSPTGVSFSGGWHPIRNRVESN
jgi:hypothetical protein